MEPKVFDDVKCHLGEGPFWHPDRAAFFWFDILSHCLYASDGATRSEWRFSEHVSAAGVIDRDTLLIASETGLYRYNLETQARDLVAPIEADNPATRSNDGRVDRYGGFWIGTMSKTAETGAGAIYRYYKGELRQVQSDISISNAICFDPAGAYAYWTDTVTQRIMRQPLDGATGWPDGPAEVFVDMRDEGWFPDGAIVDASGALWVALWGQGAVQGYDADGNKIGRFVAPTPHTTCPALGGDNLDQLFLTTALQDLEEDAHAEHDPAGRSFVFDCGLTGTPDARVLL